MHPIIVINWIHVIVKAKVLLSGTKKKKKTISEIERKR